jgi:hypothetical protein
LVRGAGRSHRRNRRGQAGGHGGSQNRARGRRPRRRHQTDFRRDNGAAIRTVCSQFVVLCRQLGLFTRAVVAIDGSKFNPDQSDLLAVDL